MIDVDRLLLDIFKSLDKDSTIRSLISDALKEQDIVYNENGYFQEKHTNPLYATFDDPTIFKIGDIIRNKNSGITAKVTTYLDDAYGLSNGCMVPSKKKDNWEKVK